MFTTETPANVPRHFVKLHYPRRISRFYRRLRLKNIRNSVEATHDLAHVRFDKFAYLPDSLGFIYGDCGNPWGFLVREGNPRPFQETRFYSAKESAVRSRVAEAFHRNFPDADVFFPGDTTYYFSNELLPGNEFRLVDTKRAPEWR